MNYLENPSEYLIVPTQPKGYYDLHDRVDVESFETYQIMHQFMAEMALRVNVALQLAVYGEEASDVEGNVYRQFDTIQHISQNLTPQFLEMINVDLNQCQSMDVDALTVAEALTFNPREIALEQRDTVIDTLRNWAVERMEQHVLPQLHITEWCEDTIPDCANFLVGYVDYALDTLSSCWFHKVATFIAYPFFCEAFFHMVNTAQDGDSLDEMLVNRFPFNTPAQEQDDEIRLLTPMRTKTVFQSYHLDTDCARLLVEEGTHLTFLWDTNDDTDQEVTFDLSDIDDYL